MTQKRLRAAVRFVLHVVANYLWSLVFVYAVELNSFGIQSLVWFFSWLFCGWFLLVVVQKTVSTLLVVIRVSLVSCGWGSSSSLVNQTVSLPVRAGTSDPGLISVIITPQSGAGCTKNLFMLCKVSRSAFCFFFLFF